MKQALAAVFYREYRIRVTNLIWLFFDMLLPLLYLLIFGLGFTRALDARFTVGGAAVDYNRFFLAGVLAMASFGVSMNATWSWFMDRDNGIFYEMLTYPLTRRQHLAGKVSFSLLISMIEALLVVAGAVLFLGVSVHWERLPLVMLWMAAGTAGWFFLFSIISIQVRRNDIYHTLINLTYFLLLFASNIFYPLDPMPVWLKTAAVLNPVTWQVDLFRYATVDLPGSFNLWLEAGLFALFILGSFLWAARTLQRHE